MRILRAFAVAAGCAFTVLALGAPVSNTELSEVCAQAEDPAHCGRLVEAVQLKRLPNLARREGNVLSVSLYPSGSTNFTDSDDVVNGRSYSLWDYLDGINAVVIYTTAGDNTTFTLLQRTTNRRNAASSFSFRPPIASTSLLRISARLDAPMRSSSGA